MSKRATMHGDGAILLLSLSLLLVTARALALIAARLGQPSVVGEIAAGVVLGPTLLGRAAPEVHAALFPVSGPRATVAEGLNVVGIVLFLFVAGAEIDVAAVGRRVRQALAVALGGMALPLAAGVGMAWLMPHTFGWEGRAPRWVFALFIGAALCISALPVIAKTLMDLGLYRSDLGMTVLASAVINDIVGWVLFAFTLSSIPGAGASSGVLDGLLVVGLMALLWALGKPLIHRLLAFIHARRGPPRMALAAMMPLVFAAAALTEHFGLHAMFGAFVVGATAAGSPHFSERTRAAMADFVSVLFAPLFFGSIGLHVDFVASFDLPAVVLVLGLACTGKVLGCFAGGRLAGIGRREAWAIGAAMNARGAMEVVLAAVALRVNLISSRTFVALVVMALVTSMASAPALRRLFPRRERGRLATALHPDTWQPNLVARDAEEAIRELAPLVAKHAGLDPELVAARAVEREQLVTTALGEGVAVPHARLDGLRHPVAALGVSRGGVVFDSPDGQPVHLVLLVVTPSDDEGLQVELLADLARVVSRAERRQALRQAASYDEVRALFESEASSIPMRADSATRAALAHEPPS